MSEMFKNHRPISPTRLTLLLCGSACLQPLLLGISIEAFENALLFGAAAVSSQLTSSWTRRQMEEWKSRVEQRLRESLQRSRPAEDNLFSVTYFMVRLDQEVRRSLRYKLPLSVLVLQFATDSSEESALAAVVTGGARMLRAEDTFAFLGLGEFAFFLPHTDAPGAQIVAARLVKALQEFRPTAGVASISEGGAAAAKDLLAEARHAAARVETAKLWNEGQAVA